METAKLTRVLKKLRDAGFFLVAGAATLAAAIAFASDRYEFVKTAAIADGLVTELNAGGSHPNVRFVDASGRSVDFPAGGWISGYRAGQRVRVLYLAKAPERSACLDAWGSVWFIPTLLGVLGATHLAVGLYLLNRK